MRIHSNVLEESDILKAVASVKGIDAEPITHHRSRSRVRAFDLALYGATPGHRRYRNRGRLDNGRDMAATRDEWGMVLAYLFRLDPAMIAGYYGGRNDFIRQTEAAYPCI